MIELKNVSLRYGAQTVLDRQNLHIAPGERIALLGPSGCGKTSLLRLVAGLISPDSGSLRRLVGRMAFLFQEPRLLPWLTAEENVNTVLADRSVSLPQARQWLDAVGLAEACRKYPGELSGGMQQRVSLARALASGSDVLLLDEPLKGLDTGTAEEMLSLLNASCAGKTLLLATHNPEEALALGARIFRYRDGCFKESSN